MLTAYQTLITLQAVLPTTKMERIQDFQSLYSNNTFTTLIDRFTSLRQKTHFGYKVTNL